MYRKIGLDKSVRFHVDWYGKCRTCEHWEDWFETHKVEEEDLMQPNLNHRYYYRGICSMLGSCHYGEETWTEGECDKWASFDPVVAEFVLKNG